LKEGVRYIAIASGPIEKRKRTLLVGIIFRKNYIEGLLSTTIAVDGTDSTERITRMIKRSRFGEQIRILLFNGIALAGLNIIDYKTLESKLNARVVFLNKRKQNAKKLILALKEFSRIANADIKERTIIVNESMMMNSIKTDGLFMQSALDKQHLKAFSSDAFEALRIAHIVARGVSGGESKGRL
jgi:uncharacterized protein